MGKKQVDTLNYYDGIAKGYGNLYHEEQKKKISLIKGFLPARGNLLDLGSGDGILNEFLGENVDVVSFDLSFNLLRENSNKNKVCGSILNLPFKDESFDFVCSFTVFQDLPDIEKAVLNVKRVLKYDGKFVISFLKVSSSSGLMASLVEREFEILEKFEEKKDFIFVLKKK